MTIILVYLLEYYFAAEKLKRVIANPTHWETTKKGTYKWQFLVYW